ncbi:flagellar biosynthesis anti-sigma factor FlgM [Falsibacillus albus]|uniref:Negative regulator of flagellin synthesis n=1 Tax=Falsibacillus albus TaxID=2478915 RepID=A0A3L7K3F0_9BACI|nr:flagellar biosynthesis anti-sigma factor FlgM [Falsibacillus albus]RLQ96799.1 flagellar biosynthesis anti-sigma factor FlgM [Falsibacillus albus]
MKINNIGPSGINPYKKQANKIEQYNKAKSMGADKVEISPAAKEMQQSSQLMKERQAKVEEIKSKVENGQYQVDPKAVAKGIFKFYKG